MGKLTRNRGGGVGWGFAGPQGQEIFLIMWDGVGRGGDWVRQNHVRQGQKPYPSDLPYPIAIPSWWHLNKIINKYLNCFLLLTIHQFVRPIHIYIYIYRERERERVKFVIFLISLNFKIKKIA